ncbi:MAG: hypothetical protein NT013_27805 [Planctomycetia bacterium]|nr:hypothetical protein [Planctomycetia bacterium]
MSQNNQLLTIRTLAQRLRRSLSLWLVIAVAVSLWSSWLSGQSAPSNQSPIYSPSTAVNDTPPKNVSTQFRTKKASSIPNNSASKNRPNATAANPVVKQAGSTAGIGQQPSSTKKSPKLGSGVVQASHEESATPAYQTMPNGVPVSPEYPPINSVPNPLSPAMSLSRPQTSGANVGFPGERTVPPQITGSHLGLLPGETATERSLRLMNVITDLEQQIAELSEINAKLNAELKSKDAKLQSGAFQFNAARKELSLAGEEFQRLRKANLDLREKYRTAERENASLMRSLSPLLKQILQGDDDPQAKD